jgi:RimJ/RimL family protein N-acetyltransferase
VNDAANDGAASLARRGPAYRIITDRLVIRCWNPEDASMLKAAVDSSIDHLRPWMPWASIHPLPLEARVAWIRACRGEFDLDKNYIYGIFDPNECRVIGGTGLHVRQGFDAREIGYWISKADAGMGYATEVAAALTRVAFEIDDVSRVEIHCAVGNERSASIPKKLGFELEAVLKERGMLVDGIKTDMMIWSMFRKGYSGSLLQKTIIKAFDLSGKRIM